MKKILTSKWFALGVGMVGFLVTLILLNPSPDPEAAAEEPETDVSTNEPPAVADIEEESPLKEQPKPIVAPPPTVPMSARQVGDPGSLRFDNPDVTELIKELHREKEALQRWEADLKELAERIALDKETIGATTQQVLRAKAAMEYTLTNQMTIQETSEAKQLRDLAGVYTNMPPDNAVKILDKMDVEDIARIISYMGPVQQAAILSNFVTNKSTADLGKATEISQKLRTLGPRPDINKRR